MPDDVPAVDGADALSMTPTDIVRDLRIRRVRYHMPDTAAYVRYAPSFQPQPDELTVHMDSAIGRQESADETGAFSLPELVNELTYAYINVHVFPDEAALEFFASGFDGALTQLGFIGGTFDWERLWMTRGPSNIGLPVAVFLGQRNAVNGQPAVTLVDHRTERRGVRVYRAVGGAGTHVGEEFYEAAAGGGAAQT
ncbi:hypothetical protein [Caenispirillum bisanense]|uniref:Uncharacterized protein n=1 Tax=Caenispirillum bisanense TaxID=414052 RepID=A0A286G1X2_9PROT|nr:hypothetical protein [Caenispirillum bisanense]SOD89468.1 hypothetical protein SAMN05421508_101229 [Caenispirillum bisanense]